MGWCESLGEGALVSIVRGYQLLGRGGEDDKDQGEVCERRRVKGQREGTLEFKGLICKGAEEEEKQTSAFFNDVIRQ